MTTIPANTTDRLNIIKITEAIRLNQYGEFEGKRHEQVYAHFSREDIRTEIVDCREQIAPFLSLELGNLSVLLSPQQFTTLRDQMNAIKL